MTIKKLCILLLLLLIILLVIVFAYNNEDFQINSTDDINDSLGFVSNGLSYVTPDVNEILNEKAYSDHSVIYSNEDNGMGSSYNLIAHNLTMQYDDSYVVSLHYGSGPVKNKNVTLEVGDKSFSNITDSNGNAYFKIGLKPGSYAVNASFENVSIKNNVSIEPIKDCGVKKNVYPISSDFEKIFLDSNGNPLINADVKFKIDGLIYNETTDSNGKAGVPLNLPAGKTEIIIYNPDGENITEEIDIVNPVIYEGTFV